MENTTCPLCQGKNGCDRAAGKAECWCFARPGLAVVKEGAACLCPTCYERVRAQQETSTGVAIDKGGS